MGRPWLAVACTGSEFFIYYTHTLTPPVLPVPRVRPAVAGQGCLYSAGPSAAEPPDAAEQPGHHPATHEAKPCSRTKGTRSSESNGGSSQRVLAGLHQQPDQPDKPTSAGPWPCQAVRDGCLQGTV